MAFLAHLGFPIRRFDKRSPLFSLQGMICCKPKKKAPIMPRRGNLCGCPAIPSALVVIVILNIRNPHGSGSTIITLLHEKINRKNWQVLSLGDYCKLRGFSTYNGNCWKVFSENPERWMIWSNNRSSNLDLILLSLLYPQIYCCG